jgi:hypothetical protein
LADSSLSIGSCAVFGPDDERGRVAVLKRLLNYRLIAVPRAGPEAGATMTPTESKGLKKGNHVYWHGHADDSGVVAETSWDAVTISWNNGKVSSIHHGDMRGVEHAPTKTRRV